MTVVQTLTRIATDWARRCFGDEHVSNLQIRSLRNLEETAELAQALGLPRETALLCINQVYDRPVGEVEQEIGGTLLTGVVLCEACGKDPEEMLEREVRRVLKKSPDHFAKRNQEKIDIGLDAGAQLSGDPFKTVCTRPAPHVCATTEPCNGLVRIEWREGERIAADRMWRNTELRKQFESESADLTGKDGVVEYAADYGERFNRWALIRIRRVVPPPGAQS